MTMAIQSGYTMLGVPDPFAEPPRDKPAAAATAAGSTDSPFPAGRDISSELGLPPLHAEQLRALTAAEEAELERQATLDAESFFDEALAGRRRGGPFGSLFGGMARMYFAAGMALAALLVLFAYAQVLQILAHLAVQPDAIRYSGYALLVALGGAILWFVGRFAWTYGRYRYVEQVSLHDLAALAERRELRAVVRRRTVEAVRRLQRYLRGYNLDDRTNLAALARFGLDVRALRTAKDWLLDHDNYASADAWIIEFRRRFQQPLDEAARARLNAYAIRATLGTAASPNGLVDSAIVLASCFSFLAELCSLYNLRLGKLATGKLLAWSFANSYLAGQIEHFTDHLAHLDIHWAGEEATAAVMQVLRPFAAKTAEGAANGLLLRRLGRQAIKLLQPVAGE
jgi:uncharacterized membrane protein YcjF (UPF0283 family)